MSNSYQSLSHSKWDCKYPVVFVPKYRKKAICGAIREHLGAIFHEWARHKECRIGEGHRMRDPVHMCLEIPPKHAVSSIIGCLTGKRALAMARQLSGKQRNFNGETIWARGDAVSTVGFEEAAICRDIREQEGNDQSGRF